MREAKHTQEDPTLDAVHQGLVEVGHSTLSEVPEVVRRLSAAAESMKREGRLLRMETRKTARESRPGMIRPAIKR